MANTSSTKAFCWMPKHCCDVNKHEIRRGCRVTSDKTLEVVGFRLPSKSGLFQEDLYPAFPSQEPASDFDTWRSGVDKPANTMELRPVKNTAKNKAAAGGLAARLGKSKAKT